MLNTTHISKCFNSTHIGKCLTLLVILASGLLPYVQTLSTVPPPWHWRTLSTWERHHEPHNVAEIDTARKYLGTQCCKKISGHTRHTGNRINTSTPRWRTLPILRLSTKASAENFFAHNHFSAHTMHINQYNYLSMMQCLNVLTTASWNFKNSHSHHQGSLNCIFRFLYTALVLGLWILGCHNSCVLKDIFFRFGMPQIKCVPKTRNQYVSLNKNLKIFLVDYFEGLETRWVFTQNKEPALKTVHGHSQASQILTRNVRLSRRLWFNFTSPAPVTITDQMSRRCLKERLSCNWQQFILKQAKGPKAKSSLKDETCCLLLRPLQPPSCRLSHGSSFRCSCLPRRFLLKNEQIFCPQRASMLSLNMLRAFWKL